MEHQFLHYLVHMYPTIKSLLALFVLITIPYLATSQNGGNYVIIINGDSVQVDLSKPIEHTTANGETMNLELLQSEILTYADELISFKYNKAYSVSKSVIEEGITQLMVMSSTGNGFMVQEYDGMDPSGLTSFILDEIVKESLSYGYKKKEKDFKHDLRSGQTIEGVQATLTYKGEKEIYTVAGYGGKDEGLLVVTMLLTEEYAEEDKPLIDLFLDTLRIKE